MRIAFAGDPNSGTAVAVSLFAAVLAYPRSKPDKKLKAERALSGKE